MSDQAVAYPADAGTDTFLLTVRGKPVPPSVEEARKLHNATAGAPPSVAGARSLGDLSHNVYVGYGEPDQTDLLFIDFWNSPTGLGQFFGNPDVQESAGKLFASRDGVVWARGNGFGEFHLSVPSGRTPQAVGMLRARVTSIDEAAKAFSAYSAATINTARTHGIVSHSTWTRVPNPGENGVPEVVGLDIWLDPDDMNRYYELGLGFEHFASVFDGPPDTSVWQAAPGEWREW
jgi:hypothetical protein